MSLARLAIVPLVVGLSWGRLLQAAETAVYSLPDPALRVVVLDSSPKESFLSVRADSLGRLFVGGREALFVYEPKADGSLMPRREIYRFPPDTWVYDIALRGDDIYVATVSAIYVLPGAVSKREGIVPRRLLWGVPLGHVHQCFHALAWGPEGDLYISMGDPVVSYGDFSRPDHWFHWNFYSQPEGAKEPVVTPYNGVGGVFRIRPDGSRFQVLARGLRNACGLVFDEHWNLFTNDNDHESLPAQYVPGRLLHVTPGAYFSWPRGWLTSKSPDRADLLETMTDGLGRFVPVGQSYYADHLLPPSYYDNLLVARWCIGAVTRYPLEHRGASFKTDEQVLVQGRDQARPVGVCVGRGGRIFFTVAYMAQNEGSPVYRADLVMLTTQDDPRAAPFHAYEITQLPLGQLLDELRQADWSRRWLAHEELLRRGRGALRAAKLRWLAGDAPDAHEQEHLIWLAAATGDEDAAVKLKALAVDAGAPAIQRLQAVRALTEYPQLGAERASFIAALADADPQVQLAAMLGLDSTPGPVPDEVVSGPARSKDTYLRQLATMSLAERAGIEQLQSLTHSADQATRLAGVLASGFRLTIPPVSHRIAPPRQLDKVRDDSAYVIQYADQKIDLRQLGPLGLYTIADHWKQARHTSQEETLFQLLREALQDPAEPVRLEAAFFLSLVHDPRSEPELASVIRATDERRLSQAKLSGIGKAWLVGPFDDRGTGFDTVHPPEAGPVDLAAAYPSRDKSVDGGKVRWQQATTKRQFELVPIYGKLDGASCYAYVQLESRTRTPAQLLVGSNDGVKVWHNGRLVWSNDVERVALPLQDVVPLELQPGSNDLLMRVRNRTGDSALYLHYRTLGDVVVRLPERLGVAGLAERLATAAASPQGHVSPEFLKVDWNVAAAQGNSEQGRKLFETIGCAKCHAVRADAPAGGGPSLADAARRFTVAHLVESILLPSKQISPIFRATHLVASDGRQWTGLLVGETAEKIELVTSDAQRVELKKSDVEAREQLETSPMPQGIIKKPEELRDILAFLLRPES